MPNTFWNDLEQALAEGLSPDAMARFLHDSLGLGPMWIGTDIEKNPAVGEKLKQAMAICDAKKYTVFASKDGEVVAQGLTLPQAIDWICGDAVERGFTGAMSVLAEEDWPKYRAVGGLCHKRGKVIRHSKRGSTALRD
jgi:hypothetical protein